MLPSNQISCLAIDDDFLCLQILERCISAVPVLHLAGSFGNALDALPVITEQPIELLFLDIQLPFILGTDFIKTLPNPPKVIFTTSYEKYAVQGFELNAVDFITKPVSFQRFLTAVNKVLRPAVYLHHAVVDIEAPVHHNGALCLRADRKNMVVNYNDILFIESVQDYCKVVTNDKTILTKQAISTLAETLPSSFIRIHRSYIVSVKKIESYTPEVVQIKNHQLPVSRSYRHEVEAALHLPGMLH